MSGDRRREREALVDRLTDRRDLSAATERAMRAVPRHAFVPADRQAGAYDDTPLPIGEGQTISAPHMVAIMTDLLEAEEGDRVLEVGTGCGYHAAVTAEVVGAGNVYSVEYHDSLARQARETLRKAGYGDVSVRAGDGREGWPAHAPYDRAYFTCAAPDFPEAVVEQVRAGGLVLAPIGERTQTLVRARKREDGGLDRERHGGVRFVPLQ
ncbi:protein-L-isoaspartate(D-aspartate) O-methyltransferase [Salinirussus salinus]|jgi:protein-L-isoaspartate(D-aspartate) O-methyltransferase|uniref:protein-L-isoaspartate(D-aspartate) O-methyltransferase n=1 Tax=Salinirussus salinus TaxID=1198300 RepID=UPI0013592E6C|nr:protein-L-isoaspartate(D-aspartate) O-methyltransferase [Salinirussus salinus]